jgi:divalent metal cation (Fe/Co/Zn/Cd) transporter
VAAVERVRSRRYAGEVKVDAVIKVDAAMSVAAAHAVADAVERTISKRWSEVGDVVVHIEPAYEDS